MKSEFGKGLVICLVKFVEHSNKLMTDLERDKKLADNNPKPIPKYIPKGQYEKFIKEKYKKTKQIYSPNATQFLFDESSTVSMWANGASDHLYEIETPKGNAWNRIRKKVKQLRKDGLAMGHGFTGKKYKKKDALALITLAQDIALMVDKKLGLKPDLGEY
jgi:hypothetical protein